MQKVSMLVPAFMHMCIAKDTPVFATVSNPHPVV